MTMFINILLATLGLVLIASVLGCFIVWRRMAYFGDALAHSALLGIALGLLAQPSTFGLPHQLGILAVALLFALLFVWLTSRRILSSDILLGILSHTALALGLISVAFFGAEGQELFDFHDILLGDLSAIHTPQIALIYAAAALILALLYWQRRSLLLLTLSEDLAKVEAVPVLRVNLLLMVLMAFFVVLAAQQIGILLIAALLIIPPAAARQISNGIPAMIGFAVLFGAIGTIGGLTLSHFAHLPAGASIVSVLAVIFFALLLIRQKINL